MIQVNELQDPSFISILEKIREIILDVVRRSGPTKLQQVRFLHRYFRWAEEWYEGQEDDNARTVRVLTTWPDPDEMHVSMKIRLAHIFAENGYMGVAITLDPKTWKDVGVAEKFKKVRPGSPLSARFDVLLDLLEKNLALDAESIRPGTLPSDMTMQLIEAIQKAKIARIKERMKDFQDSPKN